MGSFSSRFVWIRAGFTEVNYGKDWNTGEEHINLNVDYGNHEDVDK